MTPPLIAAAPAERTYDCRAKINRQVFVESTDNDSSARFVVAESRNNFGGAVSMRNDETGFRDGRNLGIAAFVRGFRGEICLGLIGKLPGDKQMLPGTR